MRHLTLVARKRLDTGSQLEISSRSDKSYAGCLPRWLTALAGACKRVEAKVLVATGSIAHGSAVGVPTVRAGWTIVLGSGCRRGPWDGLTSASHDGCRIGYIGYKACQRVSTGRNGDAGYKRQDIARGIVFKADRR